MEQTVLLNACWSSLAVFATSSSWSLFWFPWWISLRISYSGPSSWTPSRARAAKSSSCKRTTSSLLEVPLPWSGLHNSASSFPMERPGWWANLKSKQTRYRDQRAWQWLSFLAVMKCSKFLWSIQISTGCRWWGSKGLIIEQRWKQDQRGKISKLLHNCALNK